MTNPITPQSQSISNPISSSTKNLEAKTPQERRKESLDAMKKTLLDAICDTCASMIKTHRERLHQQYKKWSERRGLQ